MGSDVLDLTYWLRQSRLSSIQAWASGIPVPTCAIDDDTAITVVDGTVEVVSEGDWKLINP